MPVADKPYVAAFLIRCREGRGWTQATAIRELSAVEGVKSGTYPAWETGRLKPPPEVLERIAAFYGTQVPEEPPAVAPQSDIDRLIDSNRELTRTISLLVNALQPAGQTREQRVEGLIAQIAALQAELATIQQGGAVESPTQPAPLRRTQG